MLTRERRQPKRKDQATPGGIRGRDSAARDSIRGTRGWAWRMSVKKLAVRGARYLQRRQRAPQASSDTTGFAAHIRESHRKDMRILTSRWWRRVVGYHRNQTVSAREEQNVARRRRPTARSRMRTSVSTSGRARAATTVKLPGLNVAWTISQRPGRLPRVSVSTATSSRRG
jgi:hypothetical protein